MKKILCTGSTLWDFCVVGEAIVFDDFSIHTLQECKDKIIVVHTPSPDIIIYMNVCKAIIAETGGTLCHAAVLALEIGCPIVVAAKSATTLISDRKILTIYSREHEGIIYEELLQ